MLEGWEVPDVMLIVDDSKWSRTVAGALARRSGHAAVEVGSGEEALEQFGRARFDLVLIDVVMPWMDGFETCRRLRHLPGGRDVPIVFMTGLEELGALPDALAAGGDDLLVKPLRSPEFDVRLRAILRIYELLRVERAAAEQAIRQRRELEQLAAQKEALAQFVVHDLKSPLASVTLAISELMEQPMPDHVRAALGACASATDSVSRMVMNLLDIAGADRLPVRPAYCMVSTLFGHLRDRFAVRLYMRGVSMLMRTAMPEIWADWDLLRRVAENLIDNAVRYAPPGTEVEIRVDARDGGVALAVLDQGSGVPAEYRERIFDRFVQLDPAASSRAGRGLGLAFCKTALEAHGGWIRVEDGPAGGALFTAFFPGEERP
ncbi:MAG TPA: hybrid sensor histidine kinase/response regulator [Kofleriaceae bacterium]|nr:hybrid sensor histidine kinase/response regulator [Kofleriaceae bacterium]